MSKSEESLNNLYVNISLINNETIRDKSFEDLEIIRKELKALEIIKRTSVNPIHIKYSKDYNDFQYNIVYAYERVLTKEEFDLLKEVLKSD